MSGNASAASPSFRPRVGIEKSARGCTAFAVSGTLRRKSRFRRVHRKDEVDSDNEEAQGWMKFNGIIDVRYDSRELNTDTV